MEKFIIIIFFTLAPEETGKIDIIQYQIEQEVSSEEYCQNMARDIFNYARLSRVMTLDAQCLKKY